MTEGRTIAIGDVQGCSAALAALVRAIDPSALDTLVFLGDYIDRGPDSQGVLEQVTALAERCIVVPLPGNHEEMLLAALEGQSDLRYWLRFGGTEALASYGYPGGPELHPADLPGLTDFSPISVFTPHNLFISLSWFSIWKRRVSPVPCSYALESLGHRRRNASWLCTRRRIVA
jgi:hypothetical protein